MKKAGYVVVIVFVATIVPLLVVEYVVQNYYFITFLGNGLFALYLIVMDIWGSVYAVQVVSLARYFKQQLRSASSRKSIASPDTKSDSGTLSPEAGQRKSRRSSHLTAGTRVGVQGAAAAAALHRVVRHIGIVIIASLVCGISLIVFVLLLYLVPFSPQVNTNGYFVCLWGIHVFVEGSAIIVLTVTAYQH